MSSSGRKAVNYGKGEHVIDDIDSLNAGVLSADDLLRAFRSPDYRPPVLPAVAVELLALSRQPEVEYPAVLTLLEKDALLAGNVLRIAQSPRYANRGHTRSLKEAIVRLGIPTLTQIFFEAALNARLFRVRGYEAPMDAIRKHSMATAYISRAVAHATGLQTDFAFLCGLLHDIGLAAGLIMVASPAMGKIPPYEQVWPAIESCHEEASALLARMWKLDEGLARVLGMHHSFSATNTDEEKIAAAVCVAESVAQEFGCGATPHVDALTAEFAMQQLGLGEETMRELREYAQRVIERVD